LIHGGGGGGTKTYGSLRHDRNLYMGKLKYMGGLEYMEGKLCLQFKWTYLCEGF